MKHWFLRWLIYKWIAPFVAIVGFFEAVAILYQVQDTMHAFLAQNRKLTTLCVGISFMVSFIGELARVDRYKLDSMRERLRDDRLDQE